jgi:hypothetical protein
MRDRVRVQPFPTRSGRVSSLAALSGGRLVLSAGDDGALHLWDPVEGSCLKRMQGHTAALRYLQVRSTVLCRLEGPWSWGLQARAGLQRAR